MAAYAATLQRNTVTYTGRGMIVELEDDLEDDSYIYGRTFANRAYPVLDHMGYGIPHTTPKKAHSSVVIRWSY